MIDNNWLQFQSPVQLQRLESFLQNESATGTRNKNNGQLLADDRFNDISVGMELFERQAKLTGENLATWLICFVPLNDLDEQTRTYFNKIAEACNAILLGLTPMSSDKAILKAMSGCLWAVERESDLALGKRVLAHILAAGVAVRCRRPIPIFSEAMQEEYDLSLESKDAVNIFLRKVMRESVYGPSGELYQAIEHDGFNSTYEGPKGEKLIVQWHDLYEDERTTFLNQK